MWYQTRITELLNIQYPIIQGPFGGGASSTGLASAVSNLGGMGSYGVHHLTPSEIIKVNRDLRDKTSKPYALNLWVTNVDANADTYTDEQYNQLCVLFKPWFDELSIPVPGKPQVTGNKFEEQAQAIIEEKPPVFSFIFGVPSPDILESCRKKSIKTIGTATTPDEALALEAAGVDAVVATGFEAGGHRASFIRSAEASLTGTFALIPQVADKIRIPFIAAGGIADGRGIAAALTLGADAVQIGTAFLACEESNATAEHKARLFSEDAKHTVLSRMYTGRLARSIKSKFPEGFNAYEHQFAPYPVQRFFFNTLRMAAFNQKKFDLANFWSGQAASLLKYKKAGELFHALISQVEAIRK
jgi:nitronate monooxygenase